MLARELRDQHSVQRLWALPEAEASVLPLLSSVNDWIHRLPTGGQAAGCDLRPPCREDPAVVELAERLRLVS
jgi:hypothetical protein